MSADEKNVQVAGPETVPVGKRCRRIVSMDEKDMAHAIHTDYGLDTMTFLPDMDVLDPGSGRIFDSEVRGPLTPTCLCPMGVIYAASMEMGLMTKRISETVSSDEIDLTHCMDED